eukprot:CAMPEP_0168390014 /NCGR_PEP_ID=MMETSP0228-20121227/17258_1 /TAXON_ID=133427 /ORGANISM="Protoceratium reticulatum, Strain CCCM 535 (=CCMP 1889)" /LENGTH=283 /DNA_ID=CAMNT_0008403299 /DNA_START=237 /DNA_END=1085 /DNA_ORIENTATION=-
MKSEPVARWAMYHKQADVEMKYTQQLTRMQLHAERICMLQGQDFEMSLMREQVDWIYVMGKQLRCLLLGRNLVDGVIFSCQGLPSLLEQTGWLMGSMMGANDVAAAVSRSPGSASLPLDPCTPCQHAAPTLGTIVNGLWGFLNTSNSWGTVTGAYFAMQSVDAANFRVLQLYSSLKMLSAKLSMQKDQVFVDQGPVIAFDGVAVRTPTEALLLAGLSFKVDEGQALLICGHNGSGKSSIMRCLCGLWPVVRGQVTRPGGAAGAEEDAQLHKEMYYLPQKPCNV